MAARKAISKKVRFDVFKRDGFECQYCGAHPPAVVLHIDHINPVANGGTNHIDNLVTACDQCNLGKGARLLSDIPQSLKNKAAEIKEREDQIRGYQEVMDSRRNRISEDARAVCEIYERYNPGYTLADSAMVSVRMFVEKLGKYEVMDAMEYASSRKANRNDFKYFCGICWNKIREQQ